ESVKDCQGANKFCGERVNRLKRCDVCLSYSSRRMHKRQMQTQESKVDLGKELDTSLVVMESNGTESEVQDDSSRSGNDADADDANIKPVYEKEPIAEVQLTAKCNIFVTRQQHTEQPEIINEGRVDQYTEQYQVKSPMLDSSFDNKTIIFKSISRV
nr:hypothetical protein [Tanacetum cinerariifolium]